MPDRQQLLAVYLNNHLAGSTGGRDLFRRAASGQRESPRGPELARLAEEVDEDRDGQLELADAGHDLPRDRLENLLARAEDQADRLSLMHREVVRAALT